MTSNTTNWRKHPVNAAIVAALAFSYGVPAQAFEFQTENGWQGSFNNTISVGASWRAEGPNRKLFSAADGNRIGESGGLGGSNTSSGTLNWDKGDRFTTPFKLLSELSIKKGDVGAFVRAKAWYDQALNDEDVRVGNGDNGHKANGKLSDSSQPRLNKFDGIELLDAYVYNTFQLGENPLQIRAGRQVVNWGESLFIQGLNQVSPLDVPALRRPGTEVKEAMLPVWSLYGNLGLGNGMSVEGFYQFKWEPSVFDTCGLYWSPVEWGMSASTGSARCRQVVTSVGLVGNVAAYNGGLFITQVKGKEGKDSGQYGVALRMPIKAIDSEVGLFAMQISSRAPFVSGRTGSWGVVPVGHPARTTLNPLPAHQSAMSALGVRSAVGFWEYPDDIKLYGISLSTNVAGWSVGAELSHSPNQPVQLNGNDLLYAIVTGRGPMGATARAATAQGNGTYISGYDRLRKTQFQANTVKIFPAMLGADQGTLFGEIGMQWNDLPSNGLRYSRAFIFGFGSDATVPVPGGSTCLAGTPFSNPQPDGCKNSGYVEHFAWGYRLRGQLDYPGLISSFTVSPNLFWQHDVSGFSSDYQFIEKRKIIGIGVKFDYQKKFTIDMGYTTFANSTKYDPFRDRDYYSLSFSTTF